MLEWFTHAYNSNWLIILASKERNLPGRVSAGGEVEGDGRMTLETGCWANISTFPSFFCVSPFSQVFFFYFSPFSFLFSVAPRYYGKGMELLVGAA